MAQFGAIFLALVVVETCCTLSEVIVFFPQMRAQMTTNASGGIIMDLLAAVVLAGLAKSLKMAEPGGEPAIYRSAAITWFLVLLAGLSYVVYYQIFGFITFHFFTNQYYPHAVEQATAMGIWFWAYQWARGLMMTLAVLPTSFHCGSRAGKRPCRRHHRLDRGRRSSVAGAEHHDGAYAALHPHHRNHDPECFARHHVGASPAGRPQCARPPVESSNQ